MDDQLEDIINLLNDSTFKRCYNSGDKKQSANSLHKNEIILLENQDQQSKDNIESQDKKQQMYKPNQQQIMEHPSLQKEASQIDDQYKNQRPKTQSKQNIISSLESNIKTQQSQLISDPKQVGVTSQNQGQNSRPKLFLSKDIQQQAQEDFAEQDYINQEQEQDQFYEQVQELNSNPRPPAAAAAAATSVDQQFKYGIAGNLTNSRRQQMMMGKNNTRPPPCHNFQNTGKLAQNQKGYGPFQKK